MSPATPGCGRTPFTRPIPPSIPDRHLDYIFCSRDARVLRCSVVLDRPSPVYSSDHYGVFAELDFPEAPA